MSSPEKRCFSFNVFQGKTVGCKNTTIPNDVTAIADNAFYGCSGLTNIIIPEGVTSIGGGAFYYCDSLSTITISSSVASVGSYAFAYCKGLKEIYCYAQEAPDADRYTFYSVDANKVMLVVQEEAVEKYKAHEIWCKFNIIDKETDINSLTTDPSPKRGEIYDLSGRRVDNGKLTMDKGQLKSGIYIINGKKVAVK